MREIKFRYIFRDKEIGALRTEILSLEEIEARAMVALAKVDNEEVIARDQWTGLVDAEGTEIYENDIYKAYVAGTRRVIDRRVVSFASPERGGGFGLLWQKNMKVIGNIHQHKHLLEG